MYQKNLIGSVTRSAGVYKNDCLSPLFKAQFQKINFVTEAMQLPLLPYKKAEDWFELALHFADSLLAPRAVVLQYLAHWALNKHLPYANTALNLHYLISTYNLKSVFDLHRHFVFNQAKPILSDLIFDLLKQNQIAYRGISRGYVAYQARGVYIPQANINTCWVHFDAHSYEEDETHEGGIGFFKRVLW